MNYVILTTQWCEEHGISVPEHARKSLDGTKVIFHEDFIRPVVRTADELDTVRYSHDSEELREILNSDEWTAPETEELPASGEGEATGETA